MTARQKVITLKLSDEEHRRFEKLAKSKELTVSAMIRSIVLTYEKEKQHGIREEKDSVRNQRRSK